MTGSALLEVDSISVRYGRGRRSLQALREISLHIGVGETVGLVGESGSGKTSLANAILGLVPVCSGRVIFDGRDITGVHSPQQRRALSEHLQIVFQDPYSSLNPSRTIGQALAEPLLVHRRLPRAETEARVAAGLVRVGLTPDAARRYPSEFSGGQRQRIAIARALMLTPKLLICDEPVSALDLSVQAQVLNLLRDIQRQMALSYLFISHDLDVVRHMCHRVAVIYRGRIVETGLASQVCDAPERPYTRALLAAAPVPDPAVQEARRAARAARAAVLDR
jgi:ABC-type glutathione transport system ATPase component